MFRAAIGLLIGWSLFSASFSHAGTPWVPQWRNVLANPEPVTGLDLVSFNEQPTLLTYGPSSIHFLQPQTGASIANLQVNVKALAKWSVGPQAVYAICGNDGLNLISTGPAHVVTMTQIQAAPCHHIAVSHVGTRKLVALVRDNTIRIHQVDERDVWTLQEEIPIPEGAKAILAEADHALAVGWTGSDHITEISHRGLMKIPTGSPVNQVANGPRGWIWTDADNRAVIPLTGPPSPAARAIDRISAIDLNGDLRKDMYIQHTEGSATLLWGTLVQSSIEVEFSDVPPVAGDVDNDGCPELFTTQGQQISVYYGLCAGETASTTGVAATSVSAPPITHDFKLGHDIEFHAHVGQPLTIRLSHPNVKVERFAGRGGPLWLKVSPNGILSYTPTVQDVGMWELTIMAWETLGSVEKYPLVFNVHRTQEAAAEAVEEPQKKTRMRRRSRTYSNVRLLNNRVAFGFGGTLGFSEARNSWANLGTDWVVSGSPHLSLQLDNPESSGVWWSIAAETAPWFNYLTANMEMTHFLSTLSTVGWSFGEKAQFGVFGQAGFFITALGVRARWFPVHHAKSNTRHGLEFRASWLPSNAGVAGYGAVFYVLRLPKGL